MDKLVWPVLTLLVIKGDITANGQDCGSHLTAVGAGEVVSPGYPENYPESLNCSWTIEASQSSVVELTIEEFNVEDSALCLNDSLVVYDGSSLDSPILLPPSCGSRIAWPSHPSTLRSSGRMITITFTSNDAVSASGFRATFEQAVARDDFFLAADKTNRKIYKQERSSIRSESLPVDNLVVPVAVDFDPIERKVYFTDVGSKFIGRINIDGSYQETLATTDIDVPDGIAVDYVTRILYWTDTGTDTITVSRLDGTYRRILVNTNLDEPRDIIVQANQGYIYWSDWGITPRIEKSQGDGTNRVRLVSLGLGWPNGLALDEIENKLYWADAQLNRIERCNLDGSQRELLRNFEVDIHPFGLAIAGDGIYWTDWVTQGIDVTDRNFEEEPSTLFVNDVPTRFHGLAYHSSASPSILTRDCSLGRLNSGCNELCVLVPSGMECLAVSPVFETCPEDIHISIKESTLVEWTAPSASSPSGYHVRVTSSRGSSTSITVSPSDYIIPIIYQAMDPFDNSAECSFSISVSYDDQPPRVIMCPDDISKGISLSEEEIIVVWMEPEVFDNSGSVSLLLQSHQSGSLFGLGETEVVYLWQDEAKNNAECRFKIKITKDDDQPPRVIMCPDDISKEISLSEEEIIVVWMEPEVSDNSGSVSLLLQSHQSGSLFGLGETEVVYQWQDEAKNNAECRFKIKITKENKDAGKTTNNAVGEAGQGNIASDSGSSDLMSSTLIIISLIVIAILLVAISTGIILGKCVKCQCTADNNNDQIPVQNAYTASMHVNKGVHYISPSQPVHPQPPSVHPSAPSIYSHYVTPHDPPSGAHANSIYLEIRDPPDYSGYVSGEILSGEEAPPPPYRPSTNQTAIQ